jgi:splicing factor U2AF subunit
LQLDGVEYQDAAFQLKRPSEYVGIDPALGGGSTSDSPNKLFIGGLPPDLNEDQVMELLKSFGELKSFNLVKETVDGQLVSKGFAFCEYQDASVTDMAIQGLHNFELGDRTLTVQRADQGKNTGSDGLPGTTHFLKSRESLPPLYCWAMS